MKFPKQSLACTAVALLALSMNARADDQRAVSRDDVAAQVVAARQSGELTLIERGDKVASPVESGAPERAGAPAQSRTQVNADLSAARRSGDLAVIERGDKAEPIERAEMQQRHPMGAPLSRDDVVSAFNQARSAPPDALGVENANWGD